jgi:hypothetical protein
MLHPEVEAGAAAGALAMRVGRLVRNRETSLAEPQLA